MARPSPERRPSTVSASAGGLLDGARAKTILKELDRFANSGRKVLISRYGDEFANQIAVEARVECEKLIPQIPDIGGEKNPYSKIFDNAVLSLAVYKALKRHGKLTEEIGELHYRMFDEHLQSVPLVTRRLAGWWKMSGFTKRSIRKRSEWSQRHYYPYGWTEEYVEGDGRAFDWGVNFTQCGIVKFFHDQGADEFTKYVCLIDFATSRRLGLGVERTMTLAEGHERCDPRMKRGRQTVNKQETTIPGLV